MRDKSEELSDLIVDISKKFKNKLSCGIEDFALDLSVKDIGLIDFIGKDKKIMGEISEELSLTPGTVTAIVDNLVSLKYLKRERDESIDRRKIFISLDRRGKKLYEYLMKQRLEISKVILENLNDYDQDKMLELFRKINWSLDKND
jgi:DNA-binding MarR family transcriptional regulator